MTTPAEPKTPADRQKNNSVIEEVAEETKGRHSNGNRDSGTTGKGGGAERGGPDKDKAAERQPPDAEI